MLQLNEKGIALILVLWIMMLLIVVTFAFSVMVRTEVFSTITFKEQLENKYLAEAGLQKAMLEILYRNANKHLAPNNDEADVCKTDGSFRPSQMDDGHFLFAITDESGKINLNLMTDASGVVLNNLLLHLGVEKEQADTIVDSILDWKDADDLHRLSGAENDYYRSLPAPYSAKDAPFDTLEELLLVKGMTRTVLYGTDEKPGLLQYLTLYSPSDKINIHVAKAELLRAIPAMAEDMISLIMEYRNADNTKKDGSGLQSMLSTAQTTIAPYITTADSNVYSVEVIGCKNEQAGRYPLRAVVVAEGTNRVRILAYQSPAHVEMPHDDADQDSHP